ncbi:hypothetical protein TRFO_16840 [Tritrichomonas foetus]|uniref:Uncharacterized protein n=1 Tax=Tritrichomonas foetus TaxID=1144522 RepID=A0A1J4KPF0_9EUKA|nr:hypothetical protein TRFO_16840 [Tritrichomonas foetus]|eukprot:OHT13167.1 hypothetical protein TRFO_16840 [Tritrichomonas foetus]
MSNDQRYIPAANDVYDKVKKFISPNSKLTLTNENDNVIDKLNELIASEEEEGAFESLKQLIDQIFKDNNQFVIPDT